MLATLKVVLKLEDGAVDIRFGLYGALIMTVAFTAARAYWGS